jgi:hypothetical protein
MTNSKAACFFHGNPDKAHTLGQIGGRKNRCSAKWPTIAGFVSAGGLRDILAEAIHDVRSKKITPRTASALSQLCNSLHRVLPTADLEGSLAKLEQQPAEQEGRTSPHRDPTGSRSQEGTCGETDVQPGDVDTSAGGDGEEDVNDGSGESGK